MARRTTRNVGENAMRLAGMHLMTLSDLARALGRSRQGLSNVVGGRSKPSLETAQVLADFFAVGVQDLLSPPEDCVRAGAEAFARAPARRYGRVEADIAGVAAD